MINKVSSVILLVLVLLSAHFTPTFFEVLDLNQMIAREAFPMMVLACIVVYSLLHSRRGDRQPREVHWYVTIYSLLGIIAVAILMNSITGYLNANSPETETTLNMWEGILTVIYLVFWVGLYFLLVNLFGNFRQPSKV